MGRVQVILASDWSSDLITNLLLVQWDPARDLMTSEGREPRRMLRRRAIQIGRLKIKSM